MTGAADIPEVTLPTTRLLAVGWLAVIGVGAAWTLVVWLLGRAEWAVSGALAAGLVGVTNNLVILAMRPWKPRSIATWPMVWLAGSYSRLVLTLGGAFLLYSATQLGGRSLWLAVAVTYVAAMLGEARVYVVSMRGIGLGRDTPGPGQ